MRLDPRRLAVLGAVATAGGVLAAANALRLTPSAVSQHIARLEAETGVVLLDRSRLGGRRAAGLTPAGRVLAAHAARLADTMAAAERDLATLTGQITGPVRVGAFPTAIRHLVAPAVAALAARHPSIEVRVEQREPAPGLAALRAGALDLLLIERDPDEPVARPSGVGVVRLLDDPYRVAFPAGWAPVAGVEALLGRPWVDGPPGSAASGALDRIAAHHDTALDRPHECLEFPAVLGLVAAGLAAAVVPVLALPPRDDPAVRLLDATGVDGPYLGARRIDLLHRAGRHGPGPAAETLMAALITAAGATPVGPAAVATATPSHRHRSGGTASLTGQP